MISLLHMLPAHNKPITNRKMTQLVANTSLDSIVFYTLEKHCSETQNDRAYFACPNISNFFSAASGSSKRCRLSENPRVWSYAFIKWPCRDSTQVSSGSSKRLRPPISQVFCRHISLSTGDALSLHLCSMSSLHAVHCSGGVASQSGCPSHWLLLSTASNMARHVRPYNPICR